MLLRRRMMMETTKEQSGARYPLVNGRHTYNNGLYVDVTNGNHVSFVGGIGINGYINITNINDNTEFINTDSNINNMPTCFVLPNNSICTLSIKNIKKSENLTVGINFRSGSNSLNFSDGNFTDSADKTKTVEITNDTDVGCLFMWLSNCMYSIEFDVEFMVNGERWI